MAGLLSDLGAIQSLRKRKKKAFSDLDASVKTLEEEREERRKQLEQQRLIDKALDAEGGRSPRAKAFDAEMAAQSDKAPSNALAVSGTLRGYVPAMSDTLSGEELGELAKQETLTPAQQQSVLKHHAAKMDEARRAFKKRLYERERKQAGLDPTYPERR